MAVEDQVNGPLGTDDDQASPSDGDTGNSGGQLVHLPDEGGEVEDTDDGGAIVHLDDKTDATADPEFYGNLAESLDEDELNEHAQSLADLIDADKEARSKRDDAYKKALERTGLDGNPTGGADFAGASKVAHPMITEACVDFAAKAIKELWPVSDAEDGGPAKAQVLGKQTKDKVEKSHRKTRYMNWQMCQKMKGFRDDLEQLLTQVPMAGGQYLKMTFDKSRNRPVPFFVPLDEVYLPFEATSFTSAERVTHAQRLTGMEFSRRVTSKMYHVEGDLPSSSVIDTSETATAAASIEGKEESGAFADDEPRIVYEITCHLEIEGDDKTKGELAPYIVSIDESSKRIIGLYRNWFADDKDRDEYHFLVEWPFIPWRGAYPIGLEQLIGGLSTAATGALRALLDSAHLANFPGALKLKGGSKGGQNVEVKPGQVAEIEGSNMVDDIRKTVMPMPFAQPSPVLFQLLGFLTDAGKGVISTALEKFSEQSPNQPVGTTMALIEQGSIVFSAIHARLHGSMGRTLRLLHNLNRLHLKETEVVEELGELTVKRADFEGPIDVVPVSDPNIFSEVQRTAQVQMVAQRAAAVPGLYDMRKVEELILERTKIPNAKDLLIPAPKPQRLNSVNENVAASLGRPVVAFPDQNHLAHLKAHVGYMMSPVFGQNPLIAQILQPNMLQHIKDHIVYHYVDSVVNKASDAASAKMGQEIDISDLMDDKDPDLMKQFDEMLAIASSAVIAETEPVFKDLVPILAQVKQQMQSNMPPPPQDPTTAQVQIAQAETGRKAQADQAKASTDQAELQLRAKELALEEARGQRLEQNDERDEARETQTAMAREQGESARTQANNATKVLTNTQDNQTALTIAQGEVLAGHRSAVSTGTGINPGPGT